MPVNLPSALHRLLMLTEPLAGKRLTSRLWQRAYERACERYTGPIATVLHGRKAIINFPYTYPVNARRFPNLNRPLLEVVGQTFLAKGSRLGLIDVGAAVGDTVFLVDANCPNMVERYYCVDGDDEFFGYLQTNVGSWPNVTLFHTVLSSSVAAERALVRTHGGTASAQGDRTVGARTLDSVLAEERNPWIDVLKTDVDGFDGRVLAGATNVLAECAPSVIFEWHPGLYEKTGNDCMEPFEVLRAAGYESFVWFTKLGDFSHFMQSLDRGAIERLVEICHRNVHSYDWHYDVAAIHPRRKVDILALAELQYAKGRRSQC